MMKKIAVALVAAGGLLVAAAPAHAGGHVSLSLGIGLPVGGYGYAPPPAYYGPPAVVYAPPPVVYAPRPVYNPGYYGPPAYYAPRVVYRPRGYWHGGHDQWRDRGDWRR